MYVKNKTDGVNLATESPPPLPPNCACVCDIIYSIMYLMLFLIILVTIYHIEYLRIEIIAIK